MTVALVISKAGESTDPLATAFGADLRDIERRIVKGEKDGIIARWEFGRCIIRFRAGKKLPNGLLSRIAAEHKISRAEIHYRIQFGERFGTRDQLLTAVSNCLSWREIRTTLLKKTSAKRVTSSVRAPSKRDIQSWTKRLGTLETLPTNLRPSLHELFRILVGLGMK